MAVFKSTRVTNNAPAFSSEGTITAYAQVEVPNTLALNDTLEFFRVGAGMRIVGAHLASTDIDTAASPAVTLHVGDAGSTNRIFVSSNVGQAGTLSNAMARTALGHSYTADTLIYATVATAAGTPAAGTVTLALTLEPIR